MYAPALLDEEPTSQPFDQIDAVEELRLRTWARQNFVAEAERNLDWPPIVLDEMDRIDRESSI